MANKPRTIHHLVLRASSFAHSRFRVPHSAPYLLSPSRTPWKIAVPTIASYDFRFHGLSGAMRSARRQLALRAHLPGPDDASRLSAFFPASRTESSDRSIGKFWRTRRVLGLRSPYLRQSKTSEMP